ncbi:MAG: hypothetical protein HGA65_06470, partial [Oscillochloris sp.]|nr:hypothetical protein [Oscillochloris sp.]
MPSLYLTPASINYLSQFILVVLITSYLGLRRRTLQRGAWAWHGKWLFAFFLSVSLFSLALFVDASLLATTRLPVVYVEATLLSGIVFTLIQFAYSFLASDRPHQIERWIVGTGSAAYSLFEASFAAWRFYLLSHGTVIYRPEGADIPPALGFLWVMIIFVRGAIQNRTNRDHWRFALIFFIPLWLTILNLLNTFRLISSPLLHINISVGILFCLFFFALNYLTTRPEITTLATKLSGVIVTSVVAVFGTLPWLVTPAYAARYTPEIVDQRTLRFVPNQQGGYTISHVAFRFDQRYGTQINLVEGERNQLQSPIDFIMPFYGQTISQVMISDDGMLGMGAVIHYHDLESGFSRSPAIFPLLVNLDPERSPTGGIFVRQEAEQLLITYLRMRSYYYPDQEYTFQVLLSADGSFEISYNGLPSNLHYTLNNSPHATIWAIGAKPAQGTPSALNLARLPL